MIALNQAECVVVGRKKLEIILMTRSYNNFHIEKENLLKAVKGSLFILKSQAFDHNFIHQLDNLVFSLTTTPAPQVSCNAD